jgi:hypothetical protein
MKNAITVLVALMLVAGCTEPDQARGREPAEALQADPTQEPFMPDAPSHQVREAIRSAALEVRGDRALYQAAVMPPEQAEEEQRARAWQHVAANRAFPFNIRLRLTHRDTGAEVEAVTVDRGPFEEGRAPSIEPDPVILVSPDAARELGLEPGQEGLVWVEVVAWSL